ncbi:hypothetical protein FNB79_11235 [Formosa sediminum]|uniref:Leucine-rich repeat domain-containing protein n=1 Tax=Formosa sediminum TaxID=2594004 RepID=A0A516GSL9_9FLAO|nr:hypothetical protein [Formosa sediminum]QDO94514.1 hypothetical protein FNB79_11235 [Formosa sediminum]
MPKPTETPGFNFFEIETSFEAIKASTNYPEAFYYEIFVIAKSTANKEIRTECTQLIKKQAPEALQLAFKSRKKLTQNGGTKSVNARLISILEYGLLSEDLDLFKLYTLIYKKPELGLYSFSKAFIDKLLEHPQLLGRFNGIETLKIGLKNEGTIYDAVLNEIPKLTTLKKIEIEGEFEQLPENLGELIQLKKMLLTLPNLKQIPASIIHLKSLKKLTIKGAYRFGNRNLNTHLNDFCWLAGLDQLKVLKLHYVGVQDLSQVTFPSALKEIEFFGLDELTTLPKNLSYLTKLKRFRLMSESITTLPNGFEDLPKLEMFELIAPKIDTISAALFFGDASKPKLVTKIGNSNINIAPMTAESQQEAIDINTPKLFNYVLDNAAFFPHIKTITVNCKAPETKHQPTLAAFTSLQHINYKLEPNFEWIFDGLNASKTLETITIFKNTSYAIPVNEQPNLAVIPKGLSELENLKHLTIQFDNHLVLHTDVLPKQMEQLTLKGLKEITAGHTAFTAKNVYVEHTPITNLKSFYNLINAENLDLGKLNSFVEDDSDFTFLKKPETIKTYHYSGPAKYVEGLLKACSNLESLTLDFPEDKPAYYKALSAYKNLNLKKLEIQNYKGDSLALKALLKQVPNLEYLELRSCEGLTEFPNVNLEHLKIMVCFECDIQRISGLNAPQIEALKVSFCKDFDYDATSSVAQWKTLKYLWLEHISDTMKSYPKAISKLNLESFLITGKYSERQIPEWIGTMTSLRVLGIEGFKQPALPEALAALTQLKVLSISGCVFSEPVSEAFRTLHLDTFIYWTSKFSGSNMKFEIYEPLVGKLVPQRYFEDKDRYGPFKV